MPKGQVTTLLRNLVRDELRSLYTLHFCIVEEVDPETHRVKVVLKDDEGVQLDNESKWIPIASPIAGDGFGELYPTQPDDEGLLMVAKDPIIEMLDERGFVESKKHRQHSLQDAVFFPRIFYGDDEVPTPTDPGLGAGEHDSERYLHFHESGSFFQITGEGACEAVHWDGHFMRMTASGGIHLFHEDGYELRLGDGSYLLHPEGHRVMLSMDFAEIRYGDGPAVKLTEDETTVEGDLTVTGDLTVEGSFSVDGALSVESMTAASDISAEGSISAGSNLSVAEGLGIGAQDLSTISPTAGELYNHDGASEITADGATTSAPGLYAYDGTAEEFTAVAPFAAE